MTYILYDLHILEWQIFSNTENMEMPWPVGLIEYKTENCRKQSFWDSKTKKKKKKKKNPRKSLFFKNIFE